MADQTEGPQHTPMRACVTAHRLEDNRVLVTTDDHELHAIEQEIAAETATAPTEETTNA